ncbi:MAG: GNAT family N-acetyltransferase [Bacteroidetes bacterium]|nr:GNAT family N-acetyltransferase [Bacteroidota bacterium]
MPFIEALQPSTAAAVAQLATQLWPDTELVEMQTHYSDLLKQNQGTCFLLRTSSQFIGFIELSIRNDYVEGAEELPVAYIEGLYIDSDYRQKGLGQMLVTRAEQWAVQHGFKQLCSDVEMENQLSILFHEKAGFTEVARIVCFVKNLD